MSLSKEEVHERIRKSGEARKKRMMGIREALIGITQGCRDDMHEPDEQGMTAEVVGTHFDNASGSDISDWAIREGFQEQVVILRRRSDRQGAHTAVFNLADLIALARQAKFD